MNATHDLRRGFTRNLRLPLLGAAAMSLAATITGLAAMGTAVRSVGTAGPTPRTIAVALLVISLGLGVLSDRYALRVQRLWGDAVEARVWKRLLGRPITFFQNRPLRELLGFSASISMVRQLVGAVGLEIALSAITASLATTALTLIDARLGAIALTLTVVIGTAVAYLGRQQQRHDAVVMDGVEAAQAVLYPSLIGIDEILTFGAQGTVYEQWHESFLRQKNADRAGLRHADVAGALLTASPALFLAVLVPLARTWAGADAVVGVAIVVLQLAVAFPRVSTAIPGLFSLGLATRRLAPLYDTVPDATPAQHPDDPTPRTTTAHTTPHSPSHAGQPGQPGQLGQGHITLDHVTYSFPGASEPVLRDITLTAHAGEFVAIVGPSGAGKSTLLKLILGLLHPAEGAIHLDGASLTETDADLLRAKIGYVPQQASLLRGSLREAITGYATNVDDEAIWSALSLAGISDLVRRLPLGLETRISDGASGFSGGQEQRFLLARALVRKPTVLVLDEATSALDEAVQAEVAQAVAGLHLTRVVVAHRLSTIADADTVYELIDGELRDRAFLEPALA